LLPFVIFFSTDFFSVPFVSFFFLFSSFVTANARDVTADARYVPVVRDAAFPIFVRASPSSSGGAGETPTGGGGGYILKMPRVCVASSGGVWGGGGMWGISSMLGRSMRLSAHGGGGYGSDDDDEEPMYCEGGGGGGGGVAGVAGWSDDDVEEGAVAGMGAPHKEEQELHAGPGVSAAATPAAAAMGVGEVVPRKMKSWERVGYTSGARGRWAGWFMLKPFSPVASGTPLLTPPRGSQACDHHHHRIMKRGHMVPHMKDKSTSTTPSSLPPFAPRCGQFDPVAAAVGREQDKPPGKNKHACPGAEDLKEYAKAFPNFAEDSRKRCRTMNVKECAQADRLWDQLHPRCRLLLQGGNSTFESAAIERGVVPPSLCQPPFLRHPKPPSQSGGIIIKEVVRILEVTSSSSSI
jgi:hypothetical protein